MAREKHNWPADDDIVRIVLEHGNATLAARAMGVPRPSLAGHITARSLNDRIRDETAARRATLTAAAPAPGPDEVPDELELAKAELRDARAALRQYRAKDVDRERILQAIRDGVARVQPPTHQPLKTPPRAREDAHHRHLLLLSDFHGGERVDSGAVHGLNVYDWDVMERRVDEVLAAALSHKRRSPALTGLDLGFLGDMNSGFMHKELAETNEFGPIDGAIRVGYLLHTIVARLQPHYPEIRVFGVVGNHGRLDKAPAAKEAHNNLDWVSYKLCEALLAGKVACTFPEASDLLWRIAGRTIYVWHGDGIRSSMPGVPWGGVMRRANEIGRSYAEAGIRLDHFACGHFHQTNIVQLGRILGNGALKGTDEWVKKMFGGGERPSQLLVEFDEHAHRMTTTKYLTPTTGVGGEALELAEAA